MVAKRRRRIVATAGPLLVLMAGCLTLDDKLRDVPTGTPVQIGATWQPFVVFGTDPTREGASTPGLAGRLYVCSQTGLPIGAPGNVEVRLYPDPPNPGAPDTPLEIWKIDSATLRSKLQRDMAGWGYSLQLPWGTYKPELTHVRMTVRFDPCNGSLPLFTQNPHLTLHGDGPPQVISTTSTPVQPKG
jgi:hypothetical protein